MNSEQRELYIYTPDGECMLVELFITEDTVNIVFGNKRLDIKRESAFDLADAILMILANDEKFYD